MLHRGFALIAALAVFPVHAGLIEYSFTSQVDTAYGHTPPGAFGGLNGGDIVTGGFLFDDAAPRITTYPSGPGTTSRYDVSNLLLWVILGGQTFTATGDELYIQDRLYPWEDDRWYLTTNPDGHEVNGYTVQSMSMSLYAWSPFTNSELQVPDMTGWGDATTVFRQFAISFTDNSRVVSYVTSITPTSVPEPGTLSLLAAGVLGVLAARGRRRVAATSEPLRLTD